MLVANKYCLPTHSPFVLVKDSVCISPSFVSRSLSMVSSGCEIGFLTGNSEDPAKSCSVHHLGLLCSYARQNIPSFLLPSSSQCYTGVCFLVFVLFWLFSFFLFCWVFVWFCVCLFFSEIWISIALMLFLGQETTDMSPNCFLTALGMNLS